MSSTEKATSRVTSKKIDINRIFFYSKKIDINRIFFYRNFNNSMKKIENVN